MIDRIGTCFPPSSQWHKDEVEALDSIERQISTQFPDCRNLMINCTWFGPQFDNGEYDKILNLKSQKQTYDNLFLIAMVDEIMLRDEQIQEIATWLDARKIFLLGNFDSPYQFSFIPSIIPKYFRAYREDELSLSEPKYIFISYNRKPRQHRVELIEMIREFGLDNHGIITLGHNDPIYSHREKDHEPVLLNEFPDQYHPGNWHNSMEFGIPHDIHSLGNLDLWRQHFLHVVSETSFNSWDHMFITEKTIKPLIGMRPFVINGQQKIYRWLRDRGFRTFNHYWPHIDLENANEHDLHEKICDVIRFLITQDLESIYQDMLPSLKHNRDRYFEFAIEESHRIDRIIS